MRTVRIGLTGPIGCGKSTVAGMLAEHGAVVIDADRLVREVYEDAGGPRGRRRALRAGRSDARRLDRPTRAGADRVRRSGGPARSRGDHPSRRSAANPGRDRRRGHRACPGGRRGGHQAGREWPRRTVRRGLAGHLRPADPAWPPAGIAASRTTTPTGASPPSATSATGSSRSRPAGSTRPGRSPRRAPRSRAPGAKSNR